MNAQLSLVHYTDIEWHFDKNATQFDPQMLYLNGSHVPLRNTKISEVFTQTSRLWCMTHTLTYKQMQRKHTSMQRGRQGSICLESVSNIKARNIGTAVTKLNLLSHHKCASGREKRQTGSKFTFQTLNYFSWFIAPFPTPVSHMIQIYCLTNHRQWMLNSMLSKEEDQTVKWWNITNSFSCKF